MRCTTGTSPNMTNIDEPIKLGQLVSRLCRYSQPPESNLGSSPPVVLFLARAAVPDPAVTLCLNRVSFICLYLFMCHKCLTIFWSIHSSNNHTQRSKGAILTLPWKTTDQQDRFCYLFGEAVRFDVWLKQAFFNYLVQPKPIIRFGLCEVRRLNRALARISRIYCHIIA